MELTRHQGLGNVFLIGFLEALPEDPAEAARKYCDSVNGIGADGLIFGTPPSENSNAIGRFNLYNKDGGRAEHASDFGGRPVDHIGAKGLLARWPSRCAE